MRGADQVQALAAQACPKEPSQSVPQGSPFLGLVYRHREASVQA